MIEKAHIYPELVSELLGVSVVEIQPVLGGHSGAPKCLMKLDTGQVVFVKGAVTAYSVEALKREILAYEILGSPLLPAVLAWNEDPLILVLDDLSAARWPPPWRLGDVREVVDCLDELHAKPSSLALRSSAGPGAALRGGWAAISESPGSFLSLGLCTEQWLCDVISGLRVIDESNDFEGDSILHLDLRSDNMCRLDGGWRFVDWSSVDVGNPALDAVLWLPSLVHELGHVPAALREYSNSPLLVSFAGYLAARAGQPEPEGTSGTVRDIQLHQLRVALPLACRTAGVRSPSMRGRL